MPPICICGSIQSDDFSGLDAGFGDSLLGVGAAASPEVFESLLPAPSLDDFESLLAASSLVSFLAPDL